MLRTLREWRADCTRKQLAAFDEELARSIGPRVISQATLKQRYRGSYHYALINSSLQLHAVTIDGPDAEDTPWGMDMGRMFCQRLAASGGSLPVDEVSPDMALVVPLLMRRGVIFLAGDRYCLPAELLVELLGAEGDTSWLGLVSGMTNALLQGLVPTDAWAGMSQPKPLRTELAAWLAVHGEQARCRLDPATDLEEDDWSLLQALEQDSIDAFERLRDFFPGLVPVERHPAYYYGEEASSRFSMRRTLEQSLPARLIRLVQSGLLAIWTRPGREHFAAIVLCDEGRELIAAESRRRRKRIRDEIRRTWSAEPCEADLPSPWSLEQPIWRLWIALHFMPLTLTRQGKPRRNELKRIGKRLGEDDVDKIGFLVLGMFYAGLLRQDGDTLRPGTIDWSEATDRLREAIVRCLCPGRGGDESVWDLLADLPVDEWLDLDKVLAWLEVGAADHGLRADWQGLLMANQVIALHDLNSVARRIRWLPQFKAVVAGEALAFDAPGWRGADVSARVQGFVSAAGEIQLPPDCRHEVLSCLAGFCSLVSVEQMITLEIDPNALQRMATDRAALERARAMLETLQSPLPQAVVYLFDKQLSRGASATVAAASLVMVLDDPAVGPKMRKLGYELIQPFPDRPELVLLDASADAHAFIEACHENGIVLETLVEPRRWVEGTASVNAWMEGLDYMNRPWVEVCYQKSRRSRPRRILARIEECYYGAIGIVPVKQTRQGCRLLKKGLILEPRHILRVRELDDAEIADLGLDRL